MLGFQAPCPTDGEAQLCEPDDAHDRDQSGAGDRGNEQRRPERD